MTAELAARLPDRFWSVPYVGARFPGSPAVAERPDLAEGANCQVFAYAVLHLCAEAGRPAVWPLSAFADRPRYRTLIGVKRVTAAGARAPGVRSPSRG